MRSMQPQAVQPLLEIREKTKRLVAVSAHLGEIVSILMRSPAHAKIALGELEPLVIPAIANRQFLVIRARSRTETTPLPAAVVMWAELSNELFKHCFDNPGRPQTLTREQRKSGDNVWITDIAGEPMICNKVLDRLHKTIFVGKRLGLGRRSADGTWSSIQHAAVGTNKG